MYSLNVYSVSITAVGIYLITFIKKVHREPTCPLQPTITAVKCKGNNMFKLRSTYCSAMLKGCAKTH